MRKILLARSNLGERTVNCAGGSSTQSVGARGALGQTVNRNLALSFSVLRPDLQHLIATAGGLNALRAQKPPSTPCPPGPFNFISDYNNNVVYKLRQLPSLQVCAILTGPPFSNPQGIATDRNKNLFVADTASSTILKYAPPYNGTPFVMKDPGYFPVDVAVDPKGNVAVTNIESTSGGPGNVVLYTVGSALPTGSAQAATFSSPRFAAFDRSNRIYIDNIDIFGNNVVNVGRISPNYTSSNTITTMTTANAIGFPGGVQVTTANKPAIVDQNGGFIYTYSNTPGTNLGAPSATTIMGSSDPVGSRSTWEAIARSRQTRDSRVRCSIFTARVTSYPRNYSATVCRSARERFRPNNTKQRSSDNVARPDTERCPASSLLSTFRNGI